jgi:hypothetical protein
MKVVKNEDRTIEETPTVEILMAYNNYHGNYKACELVVAVDTMKQLINSCKLTMKNDNEFSEKVYEEAINHGFRPRVEIAKICESILRYVCCNLNVQEELAKYPNGNFFIILYINVDSDENSVVQILNPDRLDKIDRRIMKDQYPALTSGIGMTFGSRFHLLNEPQKHILLTLYEDFRNSNYSFKNYDQDDLAILFENVEKYKDTYKGDIENETLDQLCFYGFIEHRIYVNEENEINYHRFPIQNMDEFNRYYKMVNQRIQQKSA